MGKVRELVMTGIFAPAKRVSASTTPRRETAFTPVVERAARPQIREILDSPVLQRQVASDSGRVQTPHDKVVVERAKKRLALLKRFVDEYAVREGRRLRAAGERAEIIPKRQKMDIQGSAPLGELRGPLEQQRIADLNTLPLKIDITEDEVRFRVRFHVQFEDSKQEPSFSTVKSTLEEGIKLIWNQTLTGTVFWGRTFGIEPQIEKLATGAARDLHYWLVTVRKGGSGPVTYPGCTLDQPDDPDHTSVTDPTCAGGVMSIPPSHISMPDVLGHELLHLFGFLDRYMMLTSQVPGQKKQVALSSTRETKGRPDPLGAEAGHVLPEDIAFLFERLGVYEMEETRGLDALRELEAQGLTLGAVLGEIHRLEEIIRLGRDPRSLIPERKDFRDKILRGAEDL
jgi:hypothetical protein